MPKSTAKCEKFASSFAAIVFTVFILAIVCNRNLSDAKDYKKLENMPRKGQNLCIARIETNTGEPSYYSCPRPNESEKKSYCCYLDKCCDYKEFQKQTEQQFKMSQAVNYGGHITKSAVGGVLKVLLWIILFIIALIIGCCFLIFFLCRKKKLFQGGVFNSPLPSQPPGPSPYAPPTNPYMAYQWPVESVTTPRAPPAYPRPDYPPYPTANGGFAQTPYYPVSK